MVIPASRIAGVGDCEFASLGFKCKICNESAIPRFHSVKDRFAIVRDESGVGQWECVLDSCHGFRLFQGWVGGLPEGLNLRLCVGFRPFALLGVGWRPCMRSIRRGVLLLASPVLPGWVGSDFAASH